MHAPTRAIHLLQREALMAILLAWGAFPFLLTLATRPFAWLVLAFPAWAWLAWQSFQLWRELPQNRLDDNASIFPTLGLANWISWLRAPLLVYAWSLGMLRFQYPYPPSWLAISASLMLGLCTLADNLDGWAARATGRTTLLGQRLDGSMDATCIGFGSLLVYLWRQASPFYLVVGLAKPLYDLALGWHKRAGKTLQHLPPSDARRAQAGVQMTVISLLMLTPVWQPPGTYWVSLAFAVPFLAGFLRDFLVVSGRMQWRFAPQDGSLPGLPSWLNISALLMRLLVGTSTLWLMLAGNWQISLLWQAGGVLLAGLLLLGVGGRMVALLLLILVGALTAGLPPSPIAPTSYLALLAGYVACAYLGSGALSLWQPERALLHLRAGTRKQQA